ncbi:MULTISPECIES: FlgO family outer membrane protein [unclassified Desulfovibrio]|uniref:FlgO family outer membrane protein n=1 Tax=unclassified Desulfovibrio TaxID=2593640 RepID=UPI0013EA2F5F|nr:MULTISPECIES: FlgO family outer membrane protein [unclassified Desulfovibrio]
MPRLVLIILVLAVLLFPLAAAAGNVPRAGEDIAEQLDEQLMMRYAGSSPDMSKKELRALARSRILIMGTTPANLNNLEQANPLARQMLEEVSSDLVDMGYRYEELRRGKDIRFDKRTGEFILTRDVRKLASKSGVGQAILAGTYVVSGQQVRFTMSLISVATNEVIAKAMGTVPITPDLVPLLQENMPAGSGLKPSVYTRLQ